MNVLENIPGGIGVHASCFVRPLYVLKNRNDILFIQFTSREGAEEWLAEHHDHEVVKVFGSWDIAWDIANE